MRAFRISYVLTLGFCLVLAVVALTFGFYPPPTGPKAPEYPNYPTRNYSTTSSFDDPARLQQEQEYQESLKKYDEENKRYQDEQKNFLQDKIVPYAQSVFTIWTIFLVIFQVIGIILVRFVSPVVGAAYSFSGVWAVIFGPLGSLIWFVNSLIASFGSRAEREFSADPIFQSIGITSLVGIIVLTALGVILFNKLREQTA